MAKFRGSLNSTGFIYGMSDPPVKLPPPKPSILNGGLGTCAFFVVSTLVAMFFVVGSTSIFDVGFGTGGTTGVTSSGLVTVLLGGVLS